MLYVHALKIPVLSYRMDADVHIYKYVHILVDKAKLLKVYKASSSVGFYFSSCLYIRAIPHSERVS